MTIPAALCRAWGTLIVLSLGSTVLSMIVLPEVWMAVAGASILLLAWVKARIVLACYMGLARAPAWQRGFDICLGLFAAALIGLYLVPVIQ